MTVFHVVTSIGENSNKKILTEKEFLKSVYLLLVILLLWWLGLRCRVVGRCVLRVSGEGVAAHHHLRRGWRSIVGVGCVTLARHHLSSDAERGLTAGNGRAESHDAHVLLRQVRLRRVKGSANPKICNLRSTDFDLKFNRH